MNTAKTFQFPLWNLLIISNKILKFLLNIISHDFFVLIILSSRFFLHFFTQWKIYVYVYVETNCRLYLTKWNLNDDCNLCK